MMIMVLAPRERLCVVGQNGSGKSTLVRLLNGLLRPTTGHVEVDGADITRRHVADLARTVGLVFQNPDVQLFNPTVFDEVAFGPLQLQWPKEEILVRVTEMMERMEIVHLKGRSPHQLSTGVRHVFVNGVAVVRDGKHTGALPGRLVRGPGYAAGR